ncbi:hypothetical protein J7M07_07775, partial [bacterium]|nr:hypothetical protein [bacterium]
MKHFNIEEAWANELMPEGLVIPSSTVISGQGGSGKPLLGFSVISSWLKQGGNLILILTSTGKSFAEQSLKRLYNLEMTKYKKNVQFIKFDAYIE